ncbi:MAG: hypothetical protein ACTSUN_10930 [Promethearchaeota archaeon]
MKLFNKNSICIEMIENLIVNVMKQVKTLGMAIEINENGESAYVSGYGWGM